MSRGIYRTVYDSQEAVIVVYQTGRVSKKKLIHQTSRGFQRAGRCIYLVEGPNRVIEVSIKLVLSPNRSVDTSIGTLKGRKSLVEVRIRLVVCTNNLDKLYFSDS